MQHFLQTSALKKTVTLKRRVGYLDEEIGTTRAKLARMQMDVDESEKVEVATKKTDRPSEFELD